MNNRLFKTGDKVQLKTGGPVMEVVRYVMRNNFLYPQHMSTEYVECTYYSLLDKTWVKETFNQNNLVKVDSATPVWVTKLKQLLDTRPVALLN